MRRPARAPTRTRRRRSRRRPTTWPRSSSRPGWGEPLSLITPAQLRLHVPGITGDDANLEQLIDQAETLIAVWLGWPALAGVIHTLAQGTYTLRLTLGAPGDRFLRLPVAAATSIDSAFADADWAFGSDTEIPTSELELEDGDTVWLKPTSTYAWAEGPRANKVLVVNGFDANGIVDPPVSFALALTAKALLDNRRTQAASQLNQAGASITAREIAALIPAAARVALGPWINWGSRAS